MRSEPTAETRLAPCPSSPNCVSSRASDRQHGIDPIPLRTTPEQATRILRDLLSARPRTEIVEADDGYVHAVETTALLRFKDDVELEVDAAAGEIHLRSASRTGYSDLGVNRRRAVEIRAEYLRREAELAG